MRPFVLCAAPGTLKMLREMGFHTFEEYWSEDYDNIISNVDRLAKVTETIDYINQYEIKELRKMYKSMIPKLLHNYNHITKISKFYNKLNKRLAQ